MHQHADILDQQESLGGPFVQSVLLHAAIAGLLIVSSITFEHSHQVWGSANTSAGTAVAINAVKTIPLPARPGKINPVANDTESLVPQESSPKPELKKQVEVPEKAIPLPSRFSKRQPKPEVSKVYRPQADPGGPASEPHWTGRGFSDVRKARLWRRGSGRQQRFR